MQNRIVKSTRNESICAHVSKRLSRHVKIVNSVNPGALAVAN
jgi:hypothetical protein